MVVCDDHYEVEWLAERLDTHISEQVALNKKSACKVLKFHAQTSSHNLRRASQRMTVRSALSMLPPELSHSARARPRLIFIADSVTAESCSLSTKIGIVIDLGGTTQKRWNDELQIWETELVHGLG